MNNNLLQDIVSFFKNLWSLRKVPITHNTLFHILPTKDQARLLKKSGYPQTIASYYWVKDDLLDAGKFKKLVDYGNIEDLSNDDIAAAPLLTELSSVIEDLESGNPVITKEKDGIHYVRSGIYKTNDSSLVMAVIKIWMQAKGYDV